MSLIVTSQSPYLALLLNTSPAQRRALYQTATPEQRDALLEIVQNISELEHTTENDRDYVKHQRRLLNKFTSDVRKTTRTRYLKRYQLRILKLLDHFKQNIMSLL